MDLTTAIQDLQRVLAKDRNQPHWSWQLRRQLSVVREELRSDRVRSRDGWLAARASATDRNRRQLMARIGVLVSRDLDENERAFTLASRMLQDLEHFRQRLQDLAYDSVSLEIGGSE